MRVVLGPTPCRDPIGTISSCADRIKIIITSLMTGPNSHYRSSWTLAVALDIFLDSFLRQPRTVSCTSHVIRRTFPLVQTYRCFILCLFIFELFLGFLNSGPCIQSLVHTFHASISSVLVTVIVLLYSPSSSYTSQNLLYTDV